MARGLTQKQIYGRSYRLAHKIARQLVAAFPGNEMYDISAEGCTCYAHYRHSSGFTSFIKIFYCWGNMSNGGSVGMRGIIINGGSYKEINILEYRIEDILNTSKVR